MALVFLDLQVAYQLVYTMQLASFQVASYYRLGYLINTQVCDVMYTYITAKVKSDSLPLGVE